MEKEPNSCSTHRLGLRQNNRDKLGRRRPGSCINVCWYNWYRWVGGSVPCDCQGRTRWHMFFICFIFCCSFSVLEIKPGDKVFLFDFHTRHLGFWGRQRKASDYPECCICRIKFNVLSPVLSFFQLFHVTKKFLVNSSSKILLWS